GRLPRRRTQPLQRARIRRGLRPPRSEAARRSAAVLGRHRALVLPRPVPAGRSTLPWRAALLDHGPAFRADGRRRSLVAVAQTVARAVGPPDSRFATCATCTTRKNRANAGSGGSVCQLGQVVQHAQLATPAGLPTGAAGVACESGASPSS